MFLDDVSNQTMAEFTDITVAAAGKKRQIPTAPGGGPCELANLRWKVIDFGVIHKQNCT
jgi:hypothetical protein